MCSSCGAHEMDFLFGACDNGGTVASGSLDADSERGCGAGLVVAVAAEAGAGCAATTGRARTGAATTTVVDVDFMVSARCSKGFLAALSSEALAEVAAESAGRLDTAGADACAGVGDAEEDGGAALATMSLVHESKMAVAAAATGATGCFLSRLTSLASKWWDSRSSGETGRWCSTWRAQ
jgi:hypothetical protein